MRSPIKLLTSRRVAYVRLSRREALFSTPYGRMYLSWDILDMIYQYSVDDTDNTHTPFNLTHFPKSFYSMALVFTTQ